MVTLELVMVVSAAFVYLILTTELAPEVLSGIVLGVTGMAATVVGVWFGQRK